MINYLKDIPQSMESVGICKVLTVRREIIHVKHIMTEAFVKKSVNISKYLEYLEMGILSYIEYLTNRMRKIHHFNREYYQDVNKIVGYSYTNFFPSIDFLNGLNILIALDFDGVVSENSFKELYLQCLEKGKTQIFTANPTVDEGWFIKKNLPLPAKINSRKGKLSKIKALIEAGKKYDMVFYIDNEIEYLNFAFLFGIRTYHYTNNKIKYYTLL